MTTKPKQIEEVKPAQKEIMYLQGLILLCSMGRTYQDMDLRHIVQNLFPGDSNGKPRPSDEEYNTHFLHLLNSGLLNINDGQISTSRKGLLALGNTMRYERTIVFFKEIASQMRIYNELLDEAEKAKGNQVNDSQEQPS